MSRTSVSVPFPTRRRAVFQRPADGDVPLHPAKMSFAELWQQVSSDPYDLPRHEVTLRSFFSEFSFQLLRAARRTLDDEHDLLPNFKKLIRPNGICLAGSWSITEPNRYSGFFQTGRRGLVIGRASVALSETERGHYRSFGMACKLFPTSDPNEPTKTANFFLIDDNGGTRAKHFLDTELTTRPRLSLNPSSLRNLPILLAITVAQRSADRNSETRQLYPISEAGMGDRDQVRTPRFMLIKSATERRIDALDFREELRIERYGGILPFEIHVRDDKRQPWLRIGKLEFTDDVVSDTGDHRLHFSHPRSRRPV